MPDLVARIGGPQRLREILTRFYARLAADPIVGFFFAGHDLAAIVEGQHAFLSWVAKSKNRRRTRRFGGGATPKTSGPSRPTASGHGERSEPCPSVRREAAMAFGAAVELRARHPRDAHRALPPIRRGQFDRRLTILRELLEDEGLDAADVEAWLRIERSMRAVVQAP